MQKARSMEHPVPTNKFQSKGASSSKDNKPFYKKLERTDFKNDSKDKILAPFDRETLNDLRKKKLCFYYKGPYDANHDCPLRPKGKANRFMWAYYEESNLDNLDQQSDIEEIDREKKVENLSKIEFKDGEGDRQLREAHLTSIKQEGSFQMRGVLSR